jgi:nucleoside-diphosphate-sugar epimerase
MSQCDFVFFLAFDVGGSRYLKKYQQTFDFIHNNMRLMTNTFECLKETGKPFIFASSQMSAMNHSSYGVLKKIGEYYTSCLGGLIVKFWNIYGAEKDLEKSHVITDFILKAKNTRTIDMLTDGKEARQFLYVEDCCECLDVLSTKYHSLEKNKPYHISGFKWNTILEVAEEVSSCFKGTTIKPSLNTDSVQRSEKLEPDKYILNYWAPKTSLREGIRKVVSQI